MTIRVSINPDGSRSVQTLESVKRVGTPSSRVEQVRVEFADQWRATHAELERLNARLENLYGFDPVTGQRGYRRVTEDGRIRSKSEQEAFERRARDEESAIRKRIESLRERLESIQLFGERALAEAAAIDAAHAERQAELGARAERTLATAAENDRRRDMGLPPLRIPTE